MSQLPDNIKLEPREEYKSTYAYLMTVLCRFSKDVPESIPDTDPRFRQVVVLDVESSHMNTDIQAPFTINQVINSIKSHLDLLDQQARKNPNALNLKNMYATDYARITADLPEIEKKRESLSKQINDFFEYKNTELRKIIRAIEEGKPDADIQAMIAKVQEREKNFEKELKALTRAEDKISRNLQALENRTSVGAGVPTGPRPEVPTSKKT